MHIEARITEKTGDTGRKLHIGRSRNDQVATDMRLYLREEIDHITYLMLELRHTLATRALGTSSSVNAWLHASATGPAHHLWPSSAGLV